jgi:hypothetical protein
LLRVLLLGETLNVGAIKDRDRYDDVSRTRLALQLDVEIRPGRHDLHQDQPTTYP